MGALQQRRDRWAEPGQVPLAPSEAQKAIKNCSVGLQEIDCSWPYGKLSSRKALITAGKSD